MDTKVQELLEACDELVANIYDYLGDVPEDEVDGIIPLNRVQKALASLRSQLAKQEKHKG